MENTVAIEKVRSWLSSMVIGLDLCPFADAVFQAETIRYTVCPGSDSADLLEVLAKELSRLASVSRAECETTLLIAPEMLPDFLDFNDFVGIAEELLADLGLTGVIQLVGFHPKFQFADTTPEAPTNYTNRSPYPMLHLLREISVTEAAASGVNLGEIPRRNTATLERIGLTQILQRLSSV